MKKILIMMALAMPMLAGAQKFGYVNTQELFSLMPEVKDAQLSLDSLYKQYEDMMNVMQEELKKKYADYEQKRSTMTEAMQQIQEEEIYSIQQRIATFNQTAQSDVEKKRQELLAPIHERMAKAIQVIGEREGFTYIFDSAAMVYTAPSATNVIEPVKKELGIK